MKTFLDCRYWSVKFNYRYGWHMALSRYNFFFTCYIVIYFIIYYIVISFDILNLSNYSDVIELFGIIASLPAFAICIYKHPKEERAPWIWFAITAALFFYRRFSLGIYSSYNWRRTRNAINLWHILYCKYYNVRNWPCHLCFKK